MLAREKVFDGLMYLFLFICIFTSIKWSSLPELTKGEIFRFDKILLFGQFHIYYIFASLFFVLLLYVKYTQRINLQSKVEKNFLKTIFWVYFIPVNILLYIAINLKHIPVNDLGVRPIAIFFTYLIVTYYVQDIFLQNKDSKNLNKIITVMQVLIILRGLNSIVKYFLGFGHFLHVLDSVRLGEEGDFSDYFILLFIVSLIRYLFEQNDKIHRVINVSGILISSFISIFSFRRYLWVEFVIALILIYYFYSRHRKIDRNKVVFVSCSLVAIVFSLVLFMGPEKFVKNIYVGRFLTSLSIIDTSFESRYGTVTGHTEEIKEGWDNVKKHWLLGVTPYGRSLLVRVRTRYQPDVYVHNAFIGVWLVYGVLGFILFIVLYIKSLQLGYIMYFRYQHLLGLMLLVFLICQIIKNMIWHTAITNINVTVIYIFFISLVLKAKKFVVKERK